MMKTKTILLLSTLVLVTACSSHPPVKTADYVDLQRFMGEWYVIASIPTFIEKEAYNPIETYRQNPDGTIATTFRFNKGGFDGEITEYHPTGFVEDTQSNAIWKMQFVWPFKADYRIMHVSEDYSATIIGRNKRDYVWLMARSPEISDEEYARMMQLIQQQGYDLSKVQKEPHRIDS